MKRSNSLYFPKVLVAFSLVWLLISVSCGKSNGSPDYMNTQKKISERVEDLLSRMSLQEKIEQLGGFGFDTKENKRLGIPALRMSDGPSGVRYGTATAFPAGVAIAASWNRRLVSKIGMAIGQEAKSKGRNFLLGPCVNIQRHPLGGRNFESYGEDPYLAAQTAVAYIKGIQSQNVLACVKHLALNNQEWKRHQVDVTVSERALREIYLPAFKAAVQEGKVWTVMSAYNLFRGEHCSESDYLLNEILKKEWGFTGFVVSDWGSVYSTVKAAHAGLDLEMPYGNFFGKKLQKAVKTGAVDMEIIDQKIRRLMRVRFEAGLFDNPQKINKMVLHCKNHKILAMRAAEESIVLLKNKNNILPLHKEKQKSLAIIGPNAAESRSGGGGSSLVTPCYQVSPIDGLIKSASLDFRLEYAYGIPAKGDIEPLASKYIIPTNTNMAERGFWAEYYNGNEFKGEPVLKGIDETINFNWGYDAPHPKLHRENDRNHFAARWAGHLKVPKSGNYKFNIIHNDGVKLFIDNKLVIDNWQENPTLLDSGNVYLSSSKVHNIKVEYFFNGGISEIKVGWEIPGRDSLAEAVAIAKRCDTAVVFVGYSNRFESESYDRDNMEMVNQDKLIRAIVKANPKTVVVLNSGGPVLMDKWLSQVPAVLQAFYPGQEGGNAIARILLGDATPSGKMPFSFIAKPVDSPAFEGYKDESLKSNYSEGIFVGYRYLEKNNIEPLFPFGHGLSYTSFKYSNLKINSSENRHELMMDIQNIGSLPGAEVVQIYIRDKECSVLRPEKELKGYNKIFLAPGQNQTISIPIAKEAFAFYHEKEKQWKTEPGEFEILIGSSSKDIRLKGVITLK